MVSMWGGSRFWFGHDHPSRDRPSPGPLSGGLLVELWWCLERWGPQMCTFGVLGRPHQTGPLARKRPTLANPVLADPILATSNPIFWPIFLVSWWGPEGWGPERVGAQNFAFFFLLPPQFFVLFPSLLVFFVEFWWCLKRRGAQMCTFGVLGLSCCEPRRHGLVGPPGFHTTTREPQRVSVPVFKNTTKIQREDPQREREKERKWGERGKTRAKFGAPHPSGPHSSQRISRQPSGSRNEGKGCPIEGVGATGQSSVAAPKQRVPMSPDQVVEVFWVVLTVVALKWLQRACPFSTGLCWLLTKLWSPAR